MEIWVPYKYDNSYKISSHGRIMSYKSKLKYQKPLEPTILKEADAYCLTYRHWKTARLVAEHFLPKTGTHVIQKIPGNYHVENLEWVDYTTAMKHVNCLKFRKSV